MPCNDPFSFIFLDFALIPEFELDQKRNKNDTVEAAENSGKYERSEDWMRAVLWKNSRADQFRLLRPM